MNDLIALFSPKGIHSNPDLAPGQPTLERISPALSVRCASSNRLHNDRAALFFTGSPLGLGADGNGALPPDALDHLLHRFRNDPSKFTDGLSGHFALVFVDLEHRTCIAATDRIGVHRLYWATNEDGQLCLGTSLRTVRDAMQIAPELSPDALYCYMYFHMVPTPLTAYRGIHKLPPANRLIYAQNGVIVDRYWRPEFLESNSNNLQQLKHELHQTLEHSVATCSKRATGIGAFLSGGLDSSTVVGVMSQVSSNPVRAYSIGFNANEYDETPFARISASHFGAQLTSYYVTPEDVLKAIPQIAATYQEPFGNSSAIPTYYCAKVAAGDGISRMLAGDGGDELFAGNTRYAKQRHYRHFHSIPKGIRQHLLKPLVNSLPNALPYATKARNYLDQAEIPLPDRLQVYNFLYQHDPEEMFQSDYLRSIDTGLPLALLRSQYRQPEEASELNRMLYMDWQFTLADNDLRKVSTMCELAGVAVDYPLLSDEMIAFSSQVPSDLKLKNNQLRFFYRQAMQGFLAPETLSKSKHGFGLPFGVWLRENSGLRELAHDSLNSLKQRRYFNPDFIDSAIDMHRTTHAGYYGELIWVLMMLELWISTHLGQS